MRALGSARLHRVCRRILRRQTFFEMQNYSFGQEFSESSLRQNAAVTQTWSGEARLANQHAGSVRYQEPDHRAN